jgi:hypothetical protein
MGAAGDAQSRRLGYALVVMSALVTVAYATSGFAAGRVKGIQSHCAGI